MGEAWATFKNWPRWGQIGLVILILAVIGALSGGGEEPVLPTDDGSAVVDDELADDEPEESNEASDVDDPRCTSVDKSVIQAIKSGLRKGDRITPVGASAVKSDDYPTQDSAPIFDQDVWFVAAGMPGRGYGLWALTADPTKGPDGLIFAVNDVALQGSSWGAALEDQYRPTLDDDGALEAIACALP